MESPVEAPPPKVEIEPAEPQADKPQPVRAKKVKPRAQPRIVRESAKKHAEPLEKMEKAQLPAETPPVQDTVNEPGSKASDDAVRVETATANIANPVSPPASASDTQPPATVAAVNPTTLPAATAGPAVPPHFDVAYLDNPKPAYPLAARRLKLEGTVVLRVMVKASGMPETVALGQSSGTAILDEAALAAVKSWRFAPAHQANWRSTIGSTYPFVFDWSKPSGSLMHQTDEHL